MKKNKITTAGFYKRVGEVGEVGSVSYLAKRGDLVSEIKITSGGIPRFSYKEYMPDSDEEAMLVDVDIAENYKPINSGEFTTALKMLIQGVKKSYL